MNQRVADELVDDAIHGFPEKRRERPEVHSLVDQFDLFVQPLGQLLNEAAPLLDKRLLRRRTAIRRRPRRLNTVV